MEPGTVCVYATNVETMADVGALALVLNKAPQVERWTLDLADDEHVLRVVPSAGATAQIISQLVEELGYRCAELPD